LFIGQRTNIAAKHFGFKKEGVQAVQKGLIMKAQLKMHLRGFTLVELLVVIGMICVLISILLPSLGRARDQARTVICNNNLRQLGAAATNYAVANEGFYPASMQHSGSWMWDLSRQTADKMVEAGAIKDIFFCPFYYEKQEYDSLWNFTPDYRVTGYFFHFKRPVSNLPTLTSPKKYKVRMSQSLAATDSELISDTTLSQNNSFTEVYGGWTGGAHGTSHLKGPKALGANIFFMDGHCEWRPFNQMKIRSGSYDPAHWF
jgi:prepilin-type N-terminal cleavage/methylation domain-containing protein/prepilin-type processing-associated H-X9-DG protein